MSLTHVKECRWCTVCLLLVVVLFSMRIHFRLVLELSLFSSVSSLFLSWPRISMDATSETSNAFAVGGYLRFLFSSSSNEVAYVVIKQLSPARPLQQQQQHQREQEHHQHYKSRSNTHVTNSRRRDIWLPSGFIVAPAAYPRLFEIRPH